MANPESTAYRAALEVIGAVEPAVADAIRSELSDQRSSLKLIASENYASPAVLLAMGNWFSDKYAEGTIGHRFYAGCQNVDTVEQLAADHARAVFGAAHACLLGQTCACSLVCWHGRRPEPRRTHQLRLPAGSRGDRLGRAADRRGHPC